MTAPPTKDCFEFEANSKTQLPLAKIKLSQTPQKSPSKHKKPDSIDWLVHNTSLLPSTLELKATEEIKPPTYNLDRTSLHAEDDHICRICLGSEPSTRLISPCSCTGSQKYVHEECLKTWFLSRQGEDLAHCEVCRKAFLMEFTIKSICLPFRSRSTCKAWIPFMIAVVLLLSIIYICYLGIKGATNNTYIIICALVLAFICIVCCLASVLLSFSVCFERKIESWKVNNK